MSEFLTVLTSLALSPAGAVGAVILILLSLYGWTLTRAQGAGDGPR